MNANYTIKNFRVFDSKGATILLRPITILTGTNNSGKSSIVKSMILLDTFLKPLREDYENGREIDLNSYKLDFTTVDTAILGNFRQNLPQRHSNKATKMSFEYTVYSNMAGQDLTVQLTFVLDETMGQGKLDSLIIRDSKNSIIFMSSEDGNYKTDAEKVIESFFDFILIENALDQFRVWNNSSYENVDLFEEEPSKIIERCRLKLDNFFNKNEKWLLDIIEWYATKFKHNAFRKTIIKEFSNNHPEIVDVAVKWRTLFYTPLLEELAFETKDSIQRKIESIIDYDYFIDNGVKTSSDFIQRFEFFIADFAVSNHAHFIDYFRAKEREFYKREISRFPGRIQYEGKRTLYKRGDWLRFEDIIFKSNNNEDLSFDVLLRLMLKLNDCCGFSENIFYSYCFYDEVMHEDYNLHVFDMFEKYFQMLVEEAIAINLPKDLFYVGSSIVQIKRLYSLDEKDGFTSLLVSYFDAQRFFDKKIEFFVRRSRGFTPNSFINKWFNLLGIGHKVQISPDEEGLGVTLRVFKDENDSKGMLLANMGYGITQLIAILLRIETAIMDAPAQFKLKREDINEMSDDIYLSYKSDFHHEVSDYYPVPYSIAIEEPEVHLHPKFQSMLADMIVDAYENFNLHFIIETHSEYLIRKLQTLIGGKAHEISPDDVSLIYVYSPDKAKRPAGEPQVKHIEIKNDGTLTSGFGTGFFDEADSLALELMKLNLN